MVTPPGRPLDVFDVSVLGADDHVWLSASSSQGSVYGIPRPTLTWSLTTDAGPSAWLSLSVRHARREAGQGALDVGRQLNDLVFGVPDVAALFQQTRGVAASRGAQVLLRLLVAPQSLGEWPWEMLVDPQRPDQFLTMARDVHVVRAGRARTYAVRSDPVEPPLNLLMVLSSPLTSGSGADETPFDLYEEKRALLAELEPLEDRGLLRIEVEERPTMERLRARIGRQRRGFHLLHYLGHAQPNGLRLELPNRRGGLVTSARLAGLLQQMPDLRLAVFAGCETARAPVDPDRLAWPGPLSIADHCVRDACPMVVGMQAVLPFGTERLFTRFFYQALTAGQPVAEALRLARLAVADDEHTGGDLVNWSVPALFVGGSLPGPVTDPSARATPIKRVPRVALRLGVRQRDLRFISRLTELREGIDVLSGRSPARLLHVVGMPGTGKSSFLDRVLEELDDDILILSLSAGRLVQQEDGLAELCDLVHDLLRRSGRRVAARGVRDAQEWWEQRLVEELTDVPMALVIDDADQLTGDAGTRVVQALSLLTQRRSRVRVAAAAESEIATLTTPLTGAEVRRIQLQALSWPEVWQWIRRNLPVLTRYPEAELAGFYADLSHLEQWEQLSLAIEDRGNAVVDDLPDMVNVVAARLPATTREPAAPPVFGGPAEQPASMINESLSSPAPADGSRRALKVAVAGPHTEGRAAEFSRAVTRFAAQHWVSGRVVATEGGDPSSSLGELMTLPSPFVDGAASDDSIVAWMDQAVEADVVVLDFGGPQPLARVEAAARRMLDAGRLVIAAGGNDGAATYPAWVTGVLAVGAVDETGGPAAYSPHFPQEQKPDLYAGGRLTSTAISSMIADPAIQGTSVAALNVAAAAIVVWASDRGQTALDVHRVLIETARPLDPADARSARVLDVDAALASTRRQLLLDTLQNEPLELSQVLAETGLRPEVAVPLVDELVESGRLSRSAVDGAEVLEDRESLTQQYARLRTRPSGWDRTQELGGLVGRAGELARRGRYTTAKVQSLWDSGHEGRRIVALGVIEVRPELGSLDIVRSGIAEPRSAFEQYHALLAGLALAPLLDAADLERLIAAGETALAAGDLKGSDRAGLIRKLKKLRP